MKIFLLINSLGAGGTERSSFELGKFLKNQSVDVYFLSLKRKEIGIEKELEAEGFKVYFCSSGNLTGRLVFLVKLIRFHRPDIVHSALFESNLIARLSQPFAPNVKYIQSLVSTSYSKERQKDKRLPKFKFALVKFIDILSARLFTSYYHAITAEVFNHFQPLFNIADGKYFVIYRGRTDNKFKDNKHEIVGKQENFFLKLINTGRQEFVKGQILILKAVTHLKTKKGIGNIYLTILGREGESTLEIVTYIRENNLQGQVSLLGFRDDVELQLTKADVFVFSSYYEGLGGALIEAFAAGLPCICSDLPVLREVVGNEKGALFFETGNAEDLALQIEILYHNPEKRKELADYSLKRFNEKFKIETISRQMLEMYRVILEDEN